VPNIEWAVPQAIQSKFGTLNLNATDPSTGYRYQVLPDGFQVVPSLRVVQQNLSQMDGAALHPRWTSGVVATMSVRYQVNRDLAPSSQVFGGEYDDACDADLLAMNDQLVKWLNGMRNLTYANDQRYLWTGSDGNGRMLTSVELLAWGTPTFDDSETRLTFSLECPFPYAVDQTQQTTTFSDGSENVTNDGTADTWPVLQVAAASDCSGFTIENTTTGLEIVFDSTLPGASVLAAGHYLELNCFRGTAYLDGAGADYIAGIDPSLSDFFQLIATNGTPNALTFSSGGTSSLTVLWNPAWA
jgi:Siphovirus-type tail component, C-terminal domain